MMFKTLGLVAGLVLASAAPAAAQSMCSEPIAPAAVDGGTVTLDQLKANLADVKTFLKQSDDYQSCLWKELSDQKADAVRAKKPIDPAAEPAVTAKVNANQALKEKVGGEYNAAAHAYQAKHPGA